MVRYFEATITETVGDLGEKQLIAHVLRAIAPTIEDGIGVGDDAALLRPPVGAEVVISTDRVPTDLVARRFGLMNPRELGAYLAEANVSDIVAMAAEPAGLLLNVAVPSDYPLEDFRDFVKGFVAAGNAHGAPLVGGDTGYCSVPSFSATAIGWVPSGKALRRGGGRPGDKVGVTGAIGGFGAALTYFASRRAGNNKQLPAEAERRLLDRLVRPKARSDLLSALRGPGLRGAMDITDGLGQTLLEFAIASEVGIEIREESLPIHESAHEVARLTGVPLASIVFGIGLELELVVAVAGAVGGGGFSPDWEMTTIGELVEASAGVKLRRPDGSLTPLPGKGWEHFSSDAEQMIAGVEEPSPG